LCEGAKMRLPLRLGLVVVVVWVLQEKLPLLSGALLGVSLTACVAQSTVGAVLLSAVASGLGIGGTGRPGEEFGA
jgi:hypothetical protein